MALLDEAERSRAARFHRAEDRLSYVAAHALLRTLLSAVGAAAPRDWRFVLTPTGKPRLDRADGWPDLKFSLSHARGVVACAVACALEVGVDIEPLTRVADARTLARAHFSAAEADGLEAMTKDARHTAFLHLWTLKEAYLKATGEGIGGGMEAPAFDPRRVATTGETSVRVGDRIWDFRRFLTPGPSVLALAFSPDEPGSIPVRCAGTLVRAGGLHTLA